jgi:hypothetical protein
VPRKSRGSYPPEWAIISAKIKDYTDWTCVRCQHPHDPSSGYTLTVHHMDMDKSNVEWWNLVPLCQRCHLQIQHKVDMNRSWMFDHSEWFKPYVAGFYAHKYLGRSLSREEVMENLEPLLQLEKYVIRGLGVSEWMKEQTTKFR